MKTNEMVYSKGGKRNKIFQKKGGQPHPQKKIPLFFFENSWRGGGLMGKKKNRGGFFPKLGVNFFTPKKKKKIYVFNETPPTPKNSGKKSGSDPGVLKKKPPKWQYFWGFSPGPCFFQKFLINFSHLTPFFFFAAAFL